MSKFKELYIKGSHQNLQYFHDTIASTLNKDWSFRRDSFLDREFLFFRYTGDEQHPAAEVSLTQKDAQSYYIPNVVPIEKQELSIEEYNNLVEKINHVVVFFNG